MLRKSTQVLAHAFKQASSDEFTSQATCNVMCMYVDFFYEHILNISYTVQLAACKFPNFAVGSFSVKKGCLRQCTVLTRFYELPSKLVNRKDVR